jgi:hypothetical protein
LRFGRNESTDEATKLTAVWVSLLTAALAAVASLSVAFVQRESSELLTKLQAETARRLEERKAQITAEQKAYDELSAAASYYYYAVKQIEYGLVEPTKITTAENGMVAACRTRHSSPPPANTILPGPGEDLSGPHTS